MSENIGKQVYVNIDTDSYAYASKREWVEGVVVGEFTDGDLLVEYNEGGKRTREEISDIAFTQSDDIPARLKEVNPTPSSKAKK